MDPITRIIFLGGANMTSYWIATLTGYTQPDVPILKHDTDSSGNIYVPIAASGTSPNIGVAKITSMGSVSYAKTAEYIYAVTALGALVWPDGEVALISGNNPSIDTGGAATCFMTRYSSDGNIIGLVDLGSSGASLASITKLFDEFTLTCNTFSSNHGRYKRDGTGYLNLSSSTRISNTGDSAIYSRTGQIVPVSGTNDAIGFMSYLNVSLSTTSRNYLYRYNTATNTGVWAGSAFGTTNINRIQRGACRLANGNAVFLTQDSATSSFIYIVTPAGVSTISSTGDLIGSGNIEADSLGNFYVVVYNTTNETSYIHKFDSSGNIVWVRSLASGRLHSLSLIDDNTISVSGRTSAGVPIVARLPADGTLTGSYGGFTYAASTTRFSGFSSSITTGAGGSLIGTSAFSAPIYYTPASLSVGSTINNL